MAWVWLRVADTNNSPSFKVMLSMIDAAQVLTYDNVTSPGSFSDMVSRIRNRFVSPLAACLMAERLRFSRT